ncbi:MAG: S8 family serine peptidase [Cellulosilyticum sp.]|nr:S8 family serine peptidase [Cellulosilyticum sp.]
MIANKMSPLLQLALRYENLLTEDLKASFIVDSNQNLWEVVIDYIGDLNELIRDYTLVAAYNLRGGFAQIIINKNNVGDLSNAPNVLTLSLPVRLSYIDIGLGEICAGNITGDNSVISATGEGVLLAVIDSGIRYNHPDFITDKGTSRILYLWDQSIKTNGTNETVINRNSGVVYTNEQINEALGYTEEADQLAIVPSQDTLGHGTALAGIAAGNGRGSQNRQNRGVAPECELIIVKVGREDTAYPRDVEIMQGIDFAIEKAIELRKPLTILLGVGSNLAGHNGTTSLEFYINRRYNNWLLNFVVGTGNQGNQNAHASGKLEEGQSQTIQISAEAPNLKEYGCCIWKRFSDEISLLIQTPTGEETDVLNLLTPNRAYLFDEIAVLINYSAPINSIDDQEIYILFQAQGETTLGSGLWKLTLTGTQILEGNYNVWGSIVPNIEGNSIKFLNPDINQTLTTPATAYVITSVGAYNSDIRQVAAFSGRGYTADGRIAPDLVAPGVTVTVPSISNDNLYSTMSGTSVAAAFVAGAYVVMMGYGLYTLNNLNYYGEELRILLLKNARRLTSYAPYPNNIWGYGLMCIEAALINMREIDNQSS